MIDASVIRQKPGALNVVIDAKDRSDILRTVEAFTVSVRTACPVVYSPLTPGLVIINDVDYYLSDGVCGSFTRSCAPTWANCVETIGEAAANRGGELVLMATLDRKNTRWGAFAAERRWKCETDVGSVRFATVRFATVRRRKLPDWCHPMTEDPPEEYGFGPLVGGKEDLGAWLHGDGKRDGRRLATMVENGVIWVQQENRYRCHVWFRNEQRYAAANSCRLADEDTSKATA